MNGLRILFLDDNPNRWHAFRRQAVGNALTWAQTQAEALYHLQGTGPYDVAFLDHDLDEELTGRNGTGMAVAADIAGAPHRCGRVVVHSLNFPAAAEMVRVLRKAGVPCCAAPYAWMAPAPALAEANTVSAGKKGEG